MRRVKASQERDDEGEQSVLLGDGLDPEALEGVMETYVGVHARCVLVKVEERRAASVEGSAISLDERRQRAQSLEKGLQLVQRRGRRMTHDPRIRLPPPFVMASGVDRLGHRISRVISENDVELPNAMSSSTRATSSMVVAAPITWSTSRRSEGVFA